MLLTEIFRERLPNLHFEYVDDSERNKDHSSPFAVDIISAYNDIQEVGYLKISYMPRKNWNTFFPGILNFVVYLGHRFFPSEYATTPWKKIPIEVLRKHLVHGRLHIENHVSSAEQRRMETLTDDQVYQEWENLEKIAKTKYGKRMREYQQYFVDKPFVDFIRVHPEFQRQKIGSALYKAGYEWMKSKGMKLRASGTQSDQASQAWTDMEKAGYVEKEPAQWANKNIERRYLVQK